MQFAGREDAEGQRQKGDEMSQKVDRRPDRLARLTFRIFFIIKVVVANATLPSCFLLAQERGFKTKITELMLERMNPKPFSTHSARESEWTKALVVLIWMLVGV
ncbi:hypothetical protein H5410_031831 [Solanum commersonii]|uniref:Uncharacterized protein n=1 Tax=Solanum commersonii TaxID=4109 RepID=A0A9J5YKC5_SOLCO|nr:hypothetical protein H5410_031831 [Solanum commersonii]